MVVNALSVVLWIPSFLDRKIVFEDQALARPGIMALPILANLRRWNTEYLVAHRRYVLDRNLHLCHSAFRVERQDIRDCHFALSIQ